MEAVWPDSIVEENNLSQNISTLRRIFSETPGSHSYIVTVPGRGYRFVAEVREQTDNGSATVQAEQATTPTSPENQTRIAAVKGLHRLLGKTGGPLALAVLGVILLAAAVISRGPIVRWLEKHSVGSAAPATSSNAVAKSVHSIAVLPFEPLGQNMNDELLGLGMADAVIGRMSNLKQLVVLPTSAVSKYKAPTNDPLAAGRTLGADAVLSGTIQRSGDRVRATVQLSASRAVALFGPTNSIKLSPTFLAFRTRSLTVSLDLLFGIFLRKKKSSCRSITRATPLPTTRISWGSISGISDRKTGLRKRSVIFSTPSNEIPVMRSRMR